jgi:AraC-like DNA-binding protein
MPEPRQDPPRGLLNLELAEGRVRIGRYLPSPELAHVVEHYWTVRWDMRDQPPFTSETLPYPSVHLVLEEGEWRLHGVPTRRFVRTLRDAGMVFGIKFTPGGFRPLFGSPVSSLTDQVVSAGPLLPAARELACDTSRSDAWWLEHAEAVLRAHGPPVDPRAEQVNALVEHIARERQLVRVEQIVAYSGLSSRGLQRLFREYVGVSTKWVLQRYRLFEAAERLSTGEVDGAQVAHELGYFDQAHFIHDFKAIIGQSPQEFAAARHVA